MMRSNLPSASPRSCSVIGALRSATAAGAGSPGIAAAGVGSPVGAGGGAMAEVVGTVSSPVEAAGFSSVGGAATVVGASGLRACVVRFRSRRRRCHGSSRALRTHPSTARDRAAPTAGRLPPAQRQSEPRPGRSNLAYLAMDRGGGPFGGSTIPPCQSTLPASRGPARDRFPFAGAVSETAGALSGGVSAVWASAPAAPASSTTRAVEARSRSKRTLRIAKSPSEPWRRARNSLESVDPNYVIRRQQRSKKARLTLR